MNIFHKLVFILFFLLLMISTAALLSETPETETNLSQKICSLTSNLSEGEACIWYLFHSGWAVKTRNHFLIFNYWEKPGKDEKKNLENGFINPEEVAGQKVTVFVSHAHSDHFDPIILSWKKKIPDIKYIWGWRDKSSESGFCFDSGRTAIDIGGMKIYNIHHEFDGIPESAFMVQVDGLCIFHAGDHGHSQGEKNPVFKGNIDYLASISNTIDIMFTPTWGGEFYAIKKLSPAVVFPMHDGGYENQYQKFAERVKNLGLKVPVGVAHKRGDSFFYKNNNLIAEKTKEKSK